ncbi:MAG: hypothetical protein ACLU80_02230 [Dorea sp.]
MEGTVLPGVTRDSLMHILRDWGYKVNETTICRSTMSDESRS